MKSLLEYYYRFMLINWDCRNPTAANDNQLQNNTELSKRVFSWY